MPDRTQLRVGRLTRAHGLKGAIKVELYTDDPARRFTPGARFVLQVPTSSKWHGKTLELRGDKARRKGIASARGIDDPRRSAQPAMEAVERAVVGGRLAQRQSDIPAHHQVATTRIMQVLRPLTGSDGLRVFGAQAFNSLTRASRSLRLSRQLNGLA